MKQMYFARLLALFFLLNTGASVHAQLSTFQRLLYKTGSVQLFSGETTLDGGYVVGGIAADGAVSRPIMIKLGCTGEVDWVKTLGTTTTIQNVFTRVAATPDSGAVMVCNVGQFNAYSIVVLRVDKNGNTLWRKIVNQSSGDNGGYGIANTDDGGFIVTGYTNRYGTETPGSSFRDIYLFKLDADGNLVWTKTYGNNSAYDEGTSVIQTSDGGYAVCGRMIDQGTFYAYLLKTDPTGNPVFMRTYGDTLHATWAFAVRQLADGGYALVGSTTVLQQNFQSWADNFVLRTNLSGDTLWARGFYGLPNSFENASSLVVDEQENLVVGVATSSYSTIGFVPNKQMVARFRSDGTLQTAKLYNTGGSHYPVVTKALGGGFFITGHTNNYLGLDFTGNIIRTDDNLEAGCFTQDVTLQTIVAPIPIRVRTPTFSSASGGIMLNYNVEQTLDLTDTVLCQTSAPALVADFSAMPGCFGSPIQFSNESSPGVTGFSWNFGDPDSGNNNTSTLPNPTHIFAEPGTYTVQLTVSNGCQVDSVALPVEVQDLPIIDIGPDTTICRGESVLLDAGPGTDYLWNNGTSSQTLVARDSGLYIVEVFTGLCFGTDSILITVDNCDLLAIPNAFTPDGDGNNDTWKPVLGTEYSVRLMRVFSRWGEEVYTSMNANAAWDGRHNGLPAPSDVYAYYLELNYKGEVVTRKGDITLLR